MIFVLGSVQTLFEVQDISQIGDGQAVYDLGAVDDGVGVQIQPSVEYLESPVKPNNLIPSWRNLYRTKTPRALPSLTSRYEVYVINAVDQAVCEEGRTAEDSVIMSGKLERPYIVPGVA